MITTGSTELNALVEELQVHIQLLAERAAIASGKLAVSAEALSAKTAENTELKAKIAELEKPAVTP